MWRRFGRVGFLLVIVGLSSPGSATAHGPLPPLLGGSGPLCVAGCVAMETTANGKTVLHTQIPPLLPVAIDIDGQQPPRPIGVLGALLGYELTVTVSRNTSLIPSENDFTLRIDKNASAPPNLPLRAELVAGNVEDPLATKTTLGYDTLQSKAPQSFVLKVKRSAANTNSAGWTQTAETTDGTLTVTAPGQSLAVVTESFKGGYGAHGLVRPADRSQARLTLGQVVPTTVGLHLFDRPAPSRFSGTAPQPAGFQPSLTNMVLTHNSASTSLGFLTTSPTSTEGVKTVTTGSLAGLPRRVDLSLTSPDLDGDTKGDTKIDYLAATGAPSAEVKIHKTKGTGHSTQLVNLTRVPTELHAGLADTTLSEESSRTQVTWKASSRTDFSLDSDVENADSSTHTVASVADVPREITELTYTSAKNAGKVTYHAVPSALDNGRAGATRIFTRDRRAQQEFEANLPQLPVGIDRLDWSTPTKKINVGLDASDPTPSASVRLLDEDLDDLDLPPEADSRAILTTVDGVPADFDLAIDTSDANRGATYTASGPVTRVHVVGESDSSFAAEPGRDNVGDLDVLFEGIPRSVCASFPGADDISAKAGSGADCDGSGQVGLISLLLHTDGATEDLPAGTDGLFLRDGVAPGAFVARARLAGLKSLDFEKQTTQFQTGPIRGKEDTVDVHLVATGTAPRVVDTKRKVTKTLWTQVNDEDDPDDDVPYDRDGIETVLAKIPDPPSDTLAKVVALDGKVGGRPFSSIDVNVTNDRAADPASGEAALSLVRHIDYDDAAAIPMEWKTAPGEAFMPEEYPAEDFEPSSDVSLDPLPQTFRICHADFSNDCTEDVFTDANFVEHTQTTIPDSTDVVQGQHGFDFDPEDANGGSFQLKSSSPMVFNYHDLTIAPQRLVITVAAIPEEDPAPRDCEVIDAELGEWDCFEIKPGKNLTNLDNLTGTTLSFQAHSEGSGGVVARFLPPLINMLSLGFLGGAGHDTKGYLAMDTGWTADCYDGNRSLITCPFGANNDPSNGHKHLPAPEAFRMTGKLALGVDWRLASDPHSSSINPHPWTDVDLRGLIDDLAGFEFGPLFSADHRVMEADPSDAEGSVIGVADIKNRSGHVYCDDSTVFIGPAADIGELLCTSGAEGGELAP
jgi:hypothetical protein